MTRILGLALLALGVAATIGESDGRTTNATSTAGRESRAVQGSGDLYGVRADQLLRVEEGGGVVSISPRGMAHAFTLRIHSLAADGIATPGPTATQEHPEVTATAEPSVVRPDRTTEPTRDAPVFGAGVEDIMLNPEPRS